MVPEGLLDIVSSLSIGFVSLFFLTFIYFNISVLFFGLSAQTFTKWLSQHSLRPRSGFIALFLIVLSYSFGQIIEDSTDHLTDSSSDDQVHAPHPIWFLGTEYYHRLRTLCGIRNDSIYVNGLGKEVLIIDEITKDVLDRVYEDAIAVKFVNHIQKQKANQVPPKTTFISVAEADTSNSLKRFVSQVYYKCKNWCYKQPTYYDELERIQDRIDFSRSTFYVMYITSPILLILLIITVVKNLSFSSHKIRRHRLIEYQTFVLISTIIFGIVSLNGYRFSEVIFNERAFGYYYSNEKEIKRQLQCPPNNIFANIWMQSSAEYEYICRQIFGYALNDIKNQFANQYRMWEKKPAVILDLDETVIDNSSYQNFLMSRNQSFSETTWNAYIVAAANDKSLSRPVPGSLEYIDSLSKMGIKIVFISNRDSLVRHETVQTLANFGIDTSGMRNNNSINLLLKTESSDKEKRRAKVSQMFNVLQLIGDNLSDFNQEFYLMRHNGIVRRNPLVSIQPKEYNPNWLLLPNPVYGDWLSEDISGNEALYLNKAFDPPYNK